MLKKSRLILIDEGTARVDEKLKSQIESLMRERLKECTVLMIAHHLPTLEGCDRVMMVEDGALREVKPSEQFRQQ